MAANKPKPKAKRAPAKPRAKAKAKPRSAARKKAASKVPADRDERALRLRVEGSTVDQIAQVKDLGFESEDDVREALRRVLSRGAAAVSEEHRLELERLDAQVRALWPNAMTGNARANELLVQISDRRSRLLGLDEVRQPEEAPKDGVDDLAAKRAQRRSRLSKASD